MAVFQLEDLQTSVEVMVFPRTMTEHGHKLEDDAIVVVKSRVDARDDQPKLIAMDIEPFEPMAGEAFPLRLKVASAALSEQLIGRSEEHTSELQSRMRISYAVFCLKNKQKQHSQQQSTQNNTS